MRPEANSALVSNNYKNIPLISRDVLQNLAKTILERVENDLCTRLYL